MSAGPRAALLLCLAALAIVPGQASAQSPVGGLDNRSWELVSPPQKNGGKVGTPGSPRGRCPAGGKPRRSGRCRQARSVDEADFFTEARRAAPA